MKYQNKCLSRSRVLFSLQQHKTQYVKKRSVADPYIKSHPYFDCNLFCFHRSCYSSAPVGISTCVSQVLTGRKKRDASENISEETINAFNEEGEPIDFSHLISPSKVSLQSNKTG